MKLNLLRLGGFATVLVLLQALVNHNPGLFVNVGWLTIAAAQGVLFVAFGAMAFRLYRGKGWARFGLTVAIPVLANATLEVISKPDPAYPFVLLALIVPYSLAFGLGAGLSALIGRGGRSDKNT